LYVRYAAMLLFSTEFVVEGVTVRPGEKRGKGRGRDEGRGRWRMCLSLEISGLETCSQENALSRSRAAAFPL